MIIVTGAAGFIGSCLISYLNNKGHVDVWAVDDFSRTDKLKNLEQKRLAGIIHRDSLLIFLERNSEAIQCIFHLGARTDTIETDYSIFQRLNVGYSQAIFKYCGDRQIPLIYASSAATYGNGAFGFEDRHDIVSRLKPLNAYAVSKNEFDKWALEQKEKPVNWYGLKFFNVFGPNEYHKSRMASVIFHAFHQIRQTGQVKLFRSHHKDFADGEQMRDFIYVKDVVAICYEFWQKLPASGLYNLGTGEANTFLSLARYTFEGVRKRENIAFIDTPERLRNTYQYYTCAEISKLKSTNINFLTTSFRAAVLDYVSNYLSSEKGM